MWLNRLWLWNSACLLFNGYLGSFLGDKVTGAWSLTLTSIQWLLAGPAPCVFYSNYMYTLDSADESNRTLLLSCYVIGPPAPSGPGPPRLRGFQITHNDAPQSTGLLWTSDQLVAETSTWQHTTLKTDKHAGEIRTHSVSKRAAADLRLRPHRHWDRLTSVVLYLNPLSRLSLLQTVTKSAF